MGILFDEIVREHEERGAETVDVVHAGEVEWECGGMTRDAVEDPAVGLSSGSPVLGGEAVYENESESSR